MNEKQQVDAALLTAMQANEKIIAIFSHPEGRGAGDVELQSGERVVELACEPKQLVGIATGMGVYGLYPVIHLNQDDLLSGAFLQLMNAASQFRYRSGGQYSAPMAALVRYDAHLSVEPLLLQVPGLRIFAPSTFQDYGNILEQAGFDADPTIIFVPSAWPELGDAERALWEQPLGLKQAKVLREGTGITLLAYGALTRMALEAAAILDGEGKSVEVIDLRILSPLDRETILASVKKTGRLVILQDSPKSFGVGAEVAALVAELAMESLLAPIQRVAAFDTPEPGALDFVVHPDRERLLFSLRNLNDF